MKRKNISFVQCVRHLNFLLRFNIFTAILYSLIIVGVFFVAGLYFGHIAFFIIWISICAMFIFTLFKRPPRKS